MLSIVVEVLELLKTLITSSCLVSFKSSKFTTQDIHYCCTPQYCFTLFDNVVTLVLYLSHLHWIYSKLNSTFWWTHIDLVLVLVTKNFKWIWIWIQLSLTMIEDELVESTFLAKFCWYNVPALVVNSSRVGPGRQRLIRVVVGMVGGVLLCPTLIL